MVDVTIDRFPVAQLPSRYSISRTVLYERLAALKIEPQRMGKKAYINNSQLHLLDQLHQHLSQGGSTAEFLEKLGLLGEPSTQQSSGQIQKSSQLPNLAILLEALATQFPTPIPDYRDKFRFLEEAYQNEWLLSTSHLSDLLSLAPATINSKLSFARYGFVFTKAGKNGVETAWKVDKLADVENKYSYAKLPDDI